MNNKPLVCIIILTWNGKKWLEKLFPTLLKTDYGNFKILVVDNNSSDNTDKYMKKYPSIEYLKLSDNLGYAGGNNAGIKYILPKNPEYICVLNNDTQVKFDWLQKLIDVMEKNKDIAASGPMVLNWEGKTISKGTSFINLQLTQDFNKKKLKQVYDVSNIEGCCMLIKTNILKKLGLFDETYFAYFEEMDLQRRYKSAGYSIAQVGSSQIRHFEKGSQTAKDNNLKFLYIRNSLYYILKDPNKSFTFNLFIFHKEIFMKIFQKLVKFKKPGIKIYLKAYLWNIFHLLETWKIRKKEIEVSKNCLKT